ncbi:MAG: hypothetical protein PVG65_01945 [Candidatus Thorarchaeota archaeon]|jgi:hypothetical protein
MEKNLTLNSEEFGDFIRCLSNLKEICNDVDIKGGIVRQRSNDNTSIFEFDLTSIITDVDIALTNLKQKIELLRTFQGQDVTLEINDDYFMFSDQYSSLKMIVPTMELLDNKFMSEEDLQGIFNLQEEDSILNVDLRSIITERINLVTQNFNVMAIEVKFDGESASLNTSTDSKDQHVKFIGNIETNMILKKCSAILPIVPFGVDHDTDVKFEMYKDPTQDVSLNKFSTSLGSIDLNVYSRSSIIGDDDD